MVFHLLENNIVNSLEIQPILATNLETIGRDNLDHYNLNKGDVQDGKGTHRKLQERRHM